MSAGALEHDAEPTTGTLLPFRVPGSHRLRLTDDPDAHRPDGQQSTDVFNHLASLVDDAWSTLTLEQQAHARAELADLMSDAATDAAREDPGCPAIALPGRAATAALRIIISRGLIRDEWDT